jgi:translation initiation factor IF-2
MAKIRAYRLAEELGIDRAEIVERAAAVGVELKSAMAALDEDQAADLRAKLGGGKRKDVSETRVVSGKGGGAIIRRRKRAAPEPEPVPEVALEPAVDPVATPDVVVSDEDGGAEPQEVAAEPEAPSEVAPEPEVEEEPLAAEEAAEEAADEAPAPEPVAPASEPRAPATPAGTPGDPRNRGKERKRVREVVNLKEQEQFARQVTGRGAPRRQPAVVDSRTMQSPRRKRRDAPAKRALPKPAAELKRAVRVPGDISVAELARQLGSKAAQIQARLMAAGKMVSVNQSIDVDTVKLLAAEMDFEVQDTGFKEAVFIEAPELAGPGGERELRPPIITVMGHVDHGKTSLLDAIRKTSVVDGEAGGITQHIGAYQAMAGDALLTFIDTPGHAAFTAMRARGAQVTDIVILVVAASEGPMPQTLEAIEHAKAAGCPIVVAINKCDLPGADPQMTRQKLMERELVPEEFGGDTICVEVSATRGTGLDQLLEMIALQAEVLELQGEPARRARGVVLEAELDKGRGPVATVLVQDGTLRRGDIVVVGSEWGRVRQMENENGDRLKDAGPSVPVQILGLSGVPDAGATLNVVENERGAKQVIEHRSSQQQSEAVVSKPAMTLEDFFAQGADGESKELPVVLKTDVHGTCEAVKDALEKLSTDRVNLKILSASVGAPGESDVNLAKASGAVILGFNVRPDPTARRAAEQQGVDIRVYQIIYELLDEVRAAMAGLLPPTIKEVMLGRAEVRQPFTIPKIGTIAGSFVTEGLIRRNAQARLIRDGVQIYDGRVGSLRRFKDDAREVQTNFECGIGIDGYNDIKIGDVIEAYELEEHAAEL